MKIIYQIGIIFAVCWVSEILEALLPIDFPASVIGMVLLFALLSAGVLKVEHVREKSDFLLSNMAFFFVPAGVSIMNYFDVLKSILIQFVVIILVSTLLTFWVGSAVVTLVFRLQNRSRTEG